MKRCLDVSILYYIYPIQNSNTLNMSCLWEEIEATKGFDFVSCSSETLDEGPDVAGLGVDVTGDVDDAAGSEGEELGEEGVVAAFAGRILRGVSMGFRLGKGRGRTRTTAVSFGG